MLECLGCYMSNSSLPFIGRPMPGHTCAAGGRWSLPFTVGLWVGLAAVNLAQAQATPDAAAQAAAAAPAATMPQGLPDPSAMPNAQLKLALEDSRHQQRELVDLRLRLAAAESATGWLPWLLLGAVAMGGLSVWLGLRVRRLQRDQVHRVWAAAEAELHASLMPVVPNSAGAPMLSAEPPLLSTTKSNLAARSGVDADVGRKLLAPTAAQPSYADAGRADLKLSPPPDSSPRAVTVEELLDLDQQVDFFMVLGQEQAAIDLLLGHVRATGGINALPYFKLLEIYRQQGDEEAYERTRERFNQRFNAHAPTFDGDLKSGRHLEDYPALVSRLERAWPQPVRALAELEGLMLRRADLEALDLPAFHDLLTLHALVRDLPASVPAVARARAAAPPIQSTATASAAMAEPTLTMVSARDVESRGSRPVDLLLPLDVDAFDVTQPRPRLAGPGSARAMLADWMQTRSNLRASEVTVDASWTAEPVQRLQRLDLDLDLSEHTLAPREFTRPGAVTDLGLRHDHRPSDFADFDDSDLLPPSITRR